MSLVENRQVSGIGKISQLLFAVLQPGNVVANIIAGGVAEVCLILGLDDVVLILTCFSHQAGAQQCVLAHSRRIRSLLACQSWRPHAGFENRASPPSFSSISVLRSDDWQSRERICIYSRLQVLYLCLHDSGTSVCSAIGRSVVRIWESRFSTNTNMKQA